MSLEAEAWLAQRDLVECKRFRAKVTPAACVEYSRLRPDLCVDCERAGKPDPEKGKKKYPRPLQIRPVKRCACCGEPGEILGRGLKADCYYRIRAAGELWKYPTRRETEQRGN